MGEMGAEVGGEVKGDATVHFSVLFPSLSGGRQRRRRIQLSRSWGLWPFLGRTRSGRYGYG